jgi:hypothetical protein
MRGRMRDWREAFVRWATPDGSDLPRLRALFALPALLLAAGILLVTLSLNGFSSGAFYSLVNDGADPDLVAGTPQLIRADEWNVQTVWAITQVEQGLPVTNETFPGGMDATLPQDLPREDWSAAFRPHLLGFNLIESGVLDVDQAIAWKWWMPGLALIAAAYAFVLTLLPRRPLVAAGLAIGFYFTPLFQWWYLATTLWPVVWGLVVMTAITWSLKSSRRRGAWIWAGIAAYLTPAMAMGIYVPYIVPVALVVALFAVGSAAASIRTLGTRQTLARFLPVLVGGIAGAAVTAWWLYTKLDTVTAFLSTAYPGNRLMPTGAENIVGFVGAISSSFSQALAEGGLLSQNGSEASSAFFAGAFLIPVTVWITLRQRRLGLRPPWVLLSLTAAIALFLVFLFVPGWDAVAHLLLLDRTTGNRVRIGLALASFAIVPLVVRYFDDVRGSTGLTDARLSATGAARVGGAGVRPTVTRATRTSAAGVGIALAAGVAAAYALSQIAIAVVLRVGAPESLSFANLWWVYALLGAASLYFFARAQPGVAVALFVVLTVAQGVGVNPVYRGVYDLRETDVAQAVEGLDTGDQTWVAVGDRLPTAILLESGVRAYNGFQGAPSAEMWDEIDPDGEFELQWNRLAAITWTPGEGDPTLSNPYPDQILVTFDACADFAQDNIDYVLTDRDDLVSDCLAPVEEFEIASGELTIYRVN